jgi:hypothetical protein
MTILESESGRKAAWVNTSDLLRVLERCQGNINHDVSVLDEVGRMEEEVVHIGRVDDAFGRGRGRQVKRAGKSMEVECGSVWILRSSDQKSVR